MISEELVYPFFVSLFGMSNGSFLCLLLLDTCFLLSLLQKLISLLSLMRTRALGVESSGIVVIVFAHLLTPQANNMLVPPSFSSKSVVGTSFGPIMHGSTLVSCSLAFCYTISSIFFINLF